MMLKTLAIYLFEKMPNWLKFPLIFIMTPIALVCIALWFVLFLPWHKDAVRAEIMPFEERREAQINYMIREQRLHNENFKSSLDKIERKQDVIINHFLRGKNDNN